MTSLSDIDSAESIQSMASMKKDDDLKYTNLIKNRDSESAISSEQSFEEKIAIKSDEIIDLFWSLRNKSDALHKEINVHQKHIDELGSKLEAAKQATRALSDTARDLELEDIIKEFQTKIRVAVKKQMGIAEEKMDVLLKAKEKVNASLFKINALVFTGIAETLKPEERERIASGKQCPICISNTINRALDCGHVLCDTCVSKIGSSCHMCRRRFNRVIKLFMDDSGSGSGSVAAPTDDVIGDVPVPAPTVPVSPWFPVNENRTIGQGELIGVNTVGAQLRRQGWFQINQN